MKRGLLVGEHRQISELKAILPLANYQVIGSTANGIEALRLLHRLKPELVIMTLNINGLNAFDLLQSILDQHLCPVIVTITQENTEALHQVIKADVHAVLVHPFRALDVITAVLTAEHRFSKEQETNQKITRLENELRNRKIQYQALLTVIQKTGYDENTAYRKIQQHAMSERKTILAVSKDILKGLWLPE